MEPADILRALRDAKELPTAALAAASDQRAAMTPKLLDELEAFLAAPSTDPAHASTIFFLFHLFGEWRETRAFRPMTRLLRLPPETLDEVLGDGLDRNCTRVMAAVFDGDPRPLFDLVLDPHAHDFARGSACEVLAIVTLRHQMERTATERFLHDAFAQIQPRGDSFVWWGWQTAIAVLGLTGLRHLVAEAFARGYVSPVMMTLAEFDADLQHAVANPSAPWPNEIEARAFSPFGRTAEELADFAWSDPVEHARTGTDDVPPPNREGGYWAQARLPRASSFKKVGRNDPCPCGSGKKYKKCCMRVGM